VGIVAEMDRKTSPPHGFDYRIVQPTANRCIDYAFPTAIETVVGIIIIIYCNLVFTQWQ
jgi:hypothetical protein